MMNLCAKVKINTLKIKLLFFTFWQLLEAIGLLFNLTSGHSDCKNDTNSDGAKKLYGNNVTNNNNNCRKYPELDYLQQCCRYDL